MLETLVENTFLNRTSIHDRAQEEVKTTSHYREDRGTFGGGSTAYRYSHIVEMEGSARTVDGVRVGGLDKGAFDRPQPRLDVPSGHQAREVTDRSTLERMRRPRHFCGPKGAIRAL